MLLVLRDLSIRIKEEEAVRASSFSVPEGSVTALIGESGSGKTLTALAIAGLLPPEAETSGTITFCGEALDEGRIDKIRGRGISYVFQDPSSALNPVYTIEKQLRRIERSIDIEETLGKFALEGKGRSYPFELSGGMQMRAELMIASGLRPKLLIADEITASLDGKTASSIMNLLISSRKGKQAILFITHDISIAERYSDRIVVMHSGESVEEGSTEDVISHPFHPYTEALIRCSRLERMDDGRFFTIEGSMPSPAARPDGCTYKDRCDIACSGRCSWMDIDGHRVKCSHPLSFAAK